MKKILLFLWIFVMAKSAAAQETFPINGVHDQRHLTYAFRNAKIFIDYKTTIDSATLLVKDGKVTEAGKSISIPEGAVVYDLTGKIIYPSFIDLFAVETALPEKKLPERRTPKISSDTKGAFGWNQAIHPEAEAVNSFSSDEKKAEAWRNAGFGSLLFHNRDGIARGTAVLVSAGNGKENELVIKDKAAACYALDKGASQQDYPSSLMGTIALLRQTFYDAQWYKDGGYRKEFNISLDAWNRQQNLPQLIEVKDNLSLLRAGNIGKEFKITYVIKSAGDEYQRLGEIKKLNSPLIVPLNFPEPYDVADPFDALNVSLKDLKHWEMAPANASFLEKEKISFAFTAADLKDKKEFLKNIRKAIDHGLTEQEALKACTAAPASFIGMDKSIGSLRPGMIASFIITSKNIFDKESIIYENWVQGKRYITIPERMDIRGNYNLLIEGLKPLRLEITGSENVPKLTVKADTAKTNVIYSSSLNQHTLTFEYKNILPKGTIRLTGYFSDNRLSGTGQLPDGSWVKWQADLLTPHIPELKKDTAETEKPQPGELLFPNRAYGFTELPKQETVLIKNATVWTNEAAGILQNTDVLIQNGKIARVGKNINISGLTDVKTVDAASRHVTAGIIDEHSHIAISGAVNECTQEVTSEVRVGDVIDSDDINIYRQLAGGVTSSQLLHGSCNPIGGQSQLIKLRWGRTPEEMKFAGADGFIKFALGENVKQSNAGDFRVSRYPQTRMGVEQVYFNAFTRARQYSSSWKNYDKNKKNPLLIKPRRDLELEALAEILNSERFITCHSYVQSEINMLLHVADSMRFHVNTFTHILEGYKVADKMKKHGAGASTFADWWSYKIEVAEAIPYNAKIMHEAGIVVAINSDNAEMARRLNQEAAKSIKYGGVSEEEALKFVTLNPAKLLHVDDKVGSIKEGKDADLVLWSDNPLSVYAKALKTYVDGICYFDEARDLLNREYIKKERARIIQKMIKEKSKGAATQKVNESKEEIKGCDD